MCGEPRLSSLKGRDKCRLCNGDNFAMATTFADVTSRLKIVAEFSKQRRARRFDIDTDELLFESEHSTTLLPATSNEF